MDGQKMLPAAFAEWHQVQESLARLTGLELVVYDVKGAPLGLVSGESPFCRAMRMKGNEVSFCDDQCGKFIRGAGAKEKPQFFKCSTGQSVFALPLKHENWGVLIIAGGKTFSAKADYNKAMEVLKKGGVKLSPTGKHKYRFIGKKRLVEAVDLVKNTATQYFGTSFQNLKYQLRLNRQMALIENSMLLHHERDVPDLAEGMLRCVTALFDAETASLHLYEGTGGLSGAFYVYGRHEDLVRQAGAGFIDGLLKLHKAVGETYRTMNRAELDSLNLPREIGSVISIPFFSSGELAGSVNLFNTDVVSEDLPALRACVQQAAAIVDNRKLKGEISDKIRGLKTIAELNARMGAELSAEEIFRCVFEKSVELLQAERGSLMLLNDKTDELMVKVSKGMSEEIKNGLRLKPGEGIAGRVAAAGTPIMVEDMEKDERLSIKKRPRYKTKSFISLPLKAEGRVIGVLNLSDKITGSVFNQEDLQMLLGFASQAAVAVERAIFFERTEALKRVSIKDPLTGLLNWHYFNDRLVEEMDRSRRYGRPFSLAIIDIDDFRLFNKNFGREAGDLALKELSSLLRGSLRLNDILARYADEEFTLLLPETKIDRALPLAERIRKRVEAAHLREAEGLDQARLTVSVGLAEYPADGQDLKALFGNAYEALHRAKKQGKNRVEPSQPE